MKIRHIAIRNYRGIKELDWKVSGDFICFIGAGDSTKSTILDAIESALTPRWNSIFEDTDFYNLDVSQSINITLTIGQLPESFLSEQKYGLFLRGWSPQSELHDEPIEGDELVISVSLQVGKDLEPKWLIINDRMPDERRISSADRGLLGVSRLGSYTNKHLSWSTGSALSAMTGEDVKLNDLMAEAVRKIRSEINVNSLEEIAKVVEQAKKLGEALGVVSKNKIEAHLDIKKISVKESGVSLHDGNVPLRLSGSGTQRLMGLALQTGLQDKGGISLIDEIEYGLEPHRILQVVSLLKEKTGSIGQVFLTTHSPCVLQELGVNSLKVVFSENGITRIEDIVDDSEGTYQSLMRSNPFAFLAKRIIVCEGKTEIGFLRGIDKWWQENGKRGVWSYGVVAVYGGGDDKSFTMAKYFQKLKYQVLWWGDSDVPSTVGKKNELRTAGITVVDWADSLNIEGRIFKDLPWGKVQDLMRIMSDLCGEQSVVDQVKSFKTGIQSSYAQWQDSPEIREALGKASHKKSWYKDISTGESVGTIVSKCLMDISSTDLYTKIEMIRKWVNPDEYRENPS